ncbi:MAG: acyltransferase [Pseudomonadota bacterium]|nr:acyltransferase [Pseudomonadota bacterium]
MTAALSLYLDLVRFVAAIVVLLSHFAYTRISGGEYLILRRFGADAVIVFFVLSGYVIAYVSAERERTLGEYAINRCARLYSVAFPALIATVIFDQMGRVLDPALYAGWWYKDSEALWRFFANLLFVNELWFTSIRPFSNGPYWSLGYEFWYYALYGACFYCGGRIRAVLAVLIALIAGPKILMLLPAWLIGVWTYRFNRSQQVSVPIGWVLFLSPILIYSFIKASGIDIAARMATMAVIGPEFVMSKLKHSDEFLLNHLYALLVALNFIGMRAISHSLDRIPPWIEQAIRYWAGLTFSIYLLHYPALHFFAALYGGERSEPLTQILILSSTFAAIVLIGGFTERKKHLLRRVLARIARALSPKLRRRLDDWP